MTVTAQSVARRVVNLLSDTSSVRWPLVEVVRTINDGQKAIMDARPDLLSAVTIYDCTAGVLQTLPSTASKLLKVTRNASTTSSKAVRIGVMEQLDAILPGWHSMTPSAEIAHYMVDPRDPEVFYVYPPATDTAKLECLFVLYPLEVVLSAEGAVLPPSSVSDDTIPTVVLGDCSVPDNIAVGALVDYILYRLYAKNSTAGDLQRATAHYNSYTTALGIEVRSKMKTAPMSNSPLNPLHPPIGEQAAGAT